MIEYERALAIAIEAAREAGDLLRADFHRPGGPRGSGHHAEADEEAEGLIRSRLTQEMPDWGYLGEETGFAAGTSEHMWAVDPNDGTKFYLRGYRGSSVSIAVLRAATPVLGVVYAFAYPDDCGDLIAWAEGCGSIRRNGSDIQVDLSRGMLEKNSTVLVSQDAGENPGANHRCVTPARFRTITSIAYRLALTAVGEGVAAVSLNGPGTWDYAAGHALLLASGGILVDESGRPVSYGVNGKSSTSWCFGGAPEAVRVLASRPWDEVFKRPVLSYKSKFSLASRHRGRAISDAKLLSRAQGCLLGQCVGDALGAQVEFQDPEEIRSAYLDGVRELRDGGTHHTLAGQPTDDSELALMLARSLAESGRFDPRRVIDAYVHWYESDPFDLGRTIGAALGAAAGGRTPSERLRRAHESADSASQANGSLMRVSPLGILGWQRPREAAFHALVDSAFTHPNEVCLEACAVFVRAIAAAVAGSDASNAYQAALDEAHAGNNPAILETLARANHARPEHFPASRGWVLVALQNAFYQLLHAPNFEEGLVSTVLAGGDTDTNAAVCGALLGATHGREAIPARWRQAVLSCRPVLEADAVHPRPAEFWPVDLLDLAEGLLLADCEYRHVPTW
ncbi:MAG TPA: inositol monophosphatase family protein [Acidobacteriota bacterium]|nr:inositol monophosphatase family protein [Acidobacteriota bacterium]